MTQNKIMLEEISDHIKKMCHKYSTKNLILGGDFNMVLDEWLDRSPSKFHSHRINPVLEQFCLNLNVTDPWRAANPLKQYFSWFKPDGSSKSRIDFWLVSDNFVQNNVAVNVSAAPLTDHSVIQLEITPQNRGTYNRGYWKFNSSLLSSEIFCSDIITELQKISSDENIKGFINKWEFF